jgi:hypothetical protein
MAVLDKFLVQRLTKQKSEALAWSDFVLLLQDLGVSKRAQILAAVRAGNPAAVGKQIIDVVQKAVRKAAETDAANALADGKLTAAEIESIFGS